MTEHKPIVVVGAGPVGMYMALQLVEAGHAVTLLEQCDALPEDMRASTFHPATLDVLDRHGLGRRLADLGTVVPQWQYWIHGTDERVVFDLGVLSDVTKHPYRLQCEQFVLNHLIADRIEENPLFDMRLETRVTGVRDEGDFVTVRAEGPNGTEEWETPWLIAADGARSTVRKLLMLGFEGSVFPKTSITLVLDHPFDEEEPGLLPVNDVWTDDAHYSLMQVRKLWRFSYSPQQNQSISEAVSEPVAQAHLQSVFPRSEPYKILQANHYMLHERCLDNFRHGRVVFAGDSAHLNSPSGGMGMNSGLHDAQCLADHLLPVLDGEDDALLDRYDRRRRTIAREEVQRISARNYRRHRETDPEKRRVIWSGLKSVAEDPEQLREFLLDSSMIRSRQRELEID